MLIPDIIVFFHAKGNSVGKFCKSAGAKFKCMPEQLWSHVYMQLFSKIISDSATIHGI